MDEPDSVVEPPLQAGATSAPRQSENSETNFAENDGIDDELALVTLQPSDDRGIGTSLRGFAQNVRVNQKGHRAPLEIVGGFGFDGNEETLFGTGQKPGDQAIVGAAFRAGKAILARLDAFYIDYLSSFDVVDGSDLSRNTI